MITVHVELNAGDHINQAAVEATLLADKLGCIVQFKFNDYTCICRPNGNPIRLIDQYGKKEIKSKIISN